MLPLNSRNNTTVGNMGTPPATDKRSAHQLHTAFAEQLFGADPDLVLDKHWYDDGLTPESADRLMNKLATCGPEQRNLLKNYGTQLAAWLQEHTTFWKPYTESHAVLEKLREVEDKFSLRPLLLEWVNQAPSHDEAAARKTAAESIEKSVSAPGRRLLDLSNLGLTTVPPLPSDLGGKLNLSRNRLTSLTGLPQQMNALKELIIYDNPALTSLTGLPQQMNALETLRIGNNPALTSLTGLPQQMNELEALEIYHNPALTSLTGLPQQMNELDALTIYHNPALTSLDGIPPSTLANPAVRIELQGCSLSSETIAAINRGDYRARIRFDMSAHDTGNRPQKPLDDEVDAWLGPESAAPWKSYAQTQQGKALATLLMRLHGCAAFKGTHREGSVAELKAILDRMQTDEAFRDYCFAAVEASDANCHDNVQAIFDELRMQMANPAYRNGAALPEVIDFQRGKLACELIDRNVAELNLGGDPLESGQELKRLLSDDPDLKLPIQFKKIKYAGTGVISNDPVTHMQAAKAYVLKNLSNQALAKKMANDNSCAAFFEKCYPATFAAHRLLWGGVLETLTKKGQPIPDEQERLKTLPASLTAAEARIYAEDLSGVGTGMLCQALQEKALGATMTTLAEHALAHPTLPPDARKAEELDTLLKDPAWGAYLSAQNRPVDAGEEKSLRPTKEDLRAWTEKALKEEGVLV